LEIDIGFLAYLDGPASTNTIDIGKTNEEPLCLRDFNTCNMCQVGPPFLTLSLLMFRV